MSSVRPTTVSELVRDAVCDTYRVDWQHLFKSRRRGPYVVLRWQVYVVMAAWRPALDGISPGLSYPEIAEALGQKSHSSVLTAVHCARQRGWSCPLWCFAKRGQRQPREYRDRYRRLQRMLVQYRSILRAANHATVTGSNMMKPIPKTAQAAKRVQMEQMEPKRSENRATNLLSKEAAA